MHQLKVKMYITESIKHNTLPKRPFPLHRILRADLFSGPIFGCLGSE